MNLNHFYHYYKSKSGGLSNLLLGSEELDQSDQGEWVRYNMNAVNADQVNNPSGTEQTAEQLDFEASRTARIAQTVTLTAGTEYTFSVWARAASGTEPFRLRYWDNVGGSGGGSAFTASATWSALTGRYEMTFTAQNSGTFQVFIQNAADGATRRIYFWGAMLNVGGAALDYVKTEFPTGPSNPPTAPMEFGDNFAGVTAYYSLRRFTKGEDNNAIRVRRSSDDTEQDIGFDANGDLDSTALTTFVNEDVNQYTSDFSSTEDLTETNGTGAAAQSVGGVDDAYKFTLSGGSGLHQTLKTTNSNGGDFSEEVGTLTFDYYLPSGQTMDEVFVGFVSGTAQGQTTTDAWTSVSMSITAFGGGVLFFRGRSGGSQTFSADGDVFYLKNIVVTQTTADGAVTTFYDQSGNGNNATNATESEQPLVVSGGTLVTENGKAAIDFDGVDDEFNAISADLVTGNSAYAAFTIAKSTTIVSSDYYFGINATQNGAGAGTTVALTPEFAVRVNGNCIFTDSASGSQQLLSLLYDGTTIQNHSLHINGTSSAVSSSANGTSAMNVASGDFRIGGWGVSAGYLTGTMQEIIIFNSDQSANRTGIESNINDHFDIYTP
jgi:hypothetical protein